MAIAEPRERLMASRARGDWVRLRTLIALRWIAITGQMVAITLAVRAIGLQFDVGLCYLAVGAAIVANLIAIFVYPETKRLSETEAMLTQLFDIAQITFLLYLTGGLNNPYALLVIAPVTISATALELRSTVFLGLVAAGLMTLLAFYHRPLALADGSELALPELWLFGHWTAILIGMAFLAAYAYRITEETHSMADALAATQMALAREQKLTDLGGVVAAAAHELGTPLATIKLVSAELMEELSGQPALKADAELIREQADRCRDILRSMGRAGKDDLLLRSAPLATLLREAAEPHAGRGKDICYELGPGPGGDALQPSVMRRPEVIHGLRNLVQNAVDFAASTVWVSAEWTPTTVSVRIVDDGEGFPAQLIGRIGDPFVRRREAGVEDGRRPEYEGMGLGLFIAKTLLERSGAELGFANASDPFLKAAERPEKCGAVVEVTWPRHLIVPPEAGRRGLGPNRRIEA
jgi:two-component system sensor histidine kinase RegB